MPAVACPSQGVIDVESMDSSPKVALDPPSNGADPIPMCIDSPGEIPAPSSPSPTYSWTPLHDQRCGPLHGDIGAPDSKVADLKRPRSPSFAQETRVKEDALQVSFVANKTFVKNHAQWGDGNLKAQINFSPAAPTDGVDSAISAWVAFA